MVCSGCVIMTQAFTCPVARRQVAEISLRHVIPPIFTESGSIKLCSIVFLRSHELSKISELQTTKTNKLSNIIAFKPNRTTLKVEA